MGIVFPEADGKRSSTPTAKATLAAALAAGSNEEDALSIIAALQQDTKWRSSYVGHFTDQIKLALNDSEMAVASAAAGLHHIHSNMEWEADGAIIPFTKAMASCTKQSLLAAHVVVGTGSLQAQLSVPYQKRTVTGIPIGDKKQLVGSDLLEQIHSWSETGACEPSVGAAVGAVLANSSWLDLSGKVFVVLGAGSAMGPLESLLTLGATVVAVDLQREKIWTRLIALARRTSGTLIVPTRGMSLDDPSGSTKLCNCSSTP